MPWRLIISIIIFAVFLMFVTFNLDNRCDISFGFAKIEKVPVFITVFASFVLGFFSCLPLLLHVRNKYKHGSINDKKSSKKIDNDIDNDNEDKPIVVAADEKIKEDAAKAKKRFFAKRNGGN